jgi:hypothetical protein
MAMRLRSELSNGMLPDPCASADSKQKLNARVRGGAHCGVPLAQAFGGPAWLAFGIYQPDDCKDLPLRPPGPGGK